MVPIVIKDRENPAAWRVLISYKNASKKGDYSHCRFISQDSWFNSAESRFKYIFTDYGFRFLDTVKPAFNDLKIHPYKQYSSLIGFSAIEFEAESDEEAIKIFENRPELH